MTTKNAILLIVKQSPGIDYNSLLNKFAASYSNVNSARAALSRSLKDLTVLGLLSKVDNKFYILEKGESEIYTELKNKLMLGLNSLVKEKRPENDIDAIVEKLQIVIERGRQDKDLLKTSKSTLDFSISSLESIQKEVEKKARHTEYISKVFADQINALKELGFSDSVAREFSSANLGVLASIFLEIADPEITIECQNQQVINLIAEKFAKQPRNNTISMPKAATAEIFSAIEQNISVLAGIPVQIFSSALKAQILETKIVLIGSYNDLSKWR